MLRKGGNISSATSSLKLTPHPFFERAFQSFLSQSFTLTQQASGCMKCSENARNWLARQLCRHVRIADASSRLFAFKRLCGSCQTPCSFLLLLFPFVFVFSSSLCIFFFPPPASFSLLFLFFLSPLEASPRNVQVGNSG